MNNSAEVHCEGGISACVLTDKRAVDGHFALIVNCAEVDEGLVLQEVFGEGKGAVIVEHVLRCDHSAFGET